MTRATVFTDWDRSRRAAHRLSARGVIQIKVIRLSVTEWRIEEVALRQWNKEKKKFCTLRLRKRLRPEDNERHEVVK